MSQAPPSPDQGAGDDIGEVVDSRLHALDGTRSTVGTAQAAAASGQTGATTAAKTTAAAVWPEGK
ncbi:hypothetical protein ACFYW9_28120 [Streptomyces sp. NPDC002698]|uniref:hypothetical protein n=1 Tax=Streptomyces sp. NPDC002698 TaxID=3364660 RepID=UPI00369CC30D